MIVLEKTTKLSSKGQITLPKDIRDLLDTDVIKILVEDGKVIIEPVRDVAGSLKKYAKSYTPIDTAREKAWQVVAEEKASNEYK